MFNPFSFRHSQNALSDFSRQFERRGQDSAHQRTPGRTLSASRPTPASVNSTECRPAHGFLVPSPSVRTRQRVTRVTSRHCPRLSTPRSRRTSDQDDVSGDRYPPTLIRSTSVFDPPRKQFAVVYQKARNLQRNSNIPGGCLDCICFARFHHPPVSFSRRPS